MDRGTRIVVQRDHTYLEAEIAAHFVGGDTPSVALRAVDVLHRRVTDFDTRDHFTIY